ncbi:hypothetical protein [Halomarina ordinaria]|uniref:Uncharacterized protein n=1 Tax=Halomarina ordinaria TaxID=3033939 RepID=A0ABD5UF79_9EURY|nr:hypothetical protein [Halomarina sp. PSRA2]
MVCIDASVGEALRDDRLTTDIEFQTAFGESGELEITETSVEPALEDFGVEVDPRERERRLAQPVASGFGIDDRPEVASQTKSEQSRLVTEENENQRTLSGEPARDPCLYEE